jgi:type VI secretion system protein ImpA
VTGRLSCIPSERRVGRCRRRPGAGGCRRRGAAHVPLGTVEVAHWRSRCEAYATLEAPTDYLSEVEPHSPTPFLIRRAANWGRTSLPEVIAEIISQEGDVSRLFQILGNKL